MAFRRAVGRQQEMNNILSLIAVVQYIVQSNSKTPTQALVQSVELDDLTIKLITYLFTQRIFKPPLCGQLAIKHTLIDPGTFRAPPAAP